MKRPHIHCSWFSSAWRKLLLTVRSARRSHGPEGNYPHHSQPSRHPFRRNLAGRLQRLAQIERHSAEGGLPRVSAEEYLAGLPNPLPSPAMASFLACPGSMAAFELECDGQRKAVGLKLVAYGGNPVFVRQALSAAALPQELDAVHPVFAR